MGDDAVFVVDVSGSTSVSFAGDPVGDLNGDGLFDTILDAEIAAYIALNQSLVDRGLGNTSNVSIVTFESSSTILDLDPVAAGVQVSTTPLADTDGNGVRDVDQALRALTDGGFTNYEAGLQNAISVLGTVGTTAANGNVIFLSDGQPNTPSSNFAIYADEVTMIRDTLGMNLRAFGVGAGASLPALQAVDAAAQTFSNTNELLAAFGGGGGGAAGNPSGFDQLAVYGFSSELGGDRWLIDTNSDGVVNTGEGDILTLQPPVAGFNVLGALPVAGNFDGVLANGDEIGLYFAGQWALDTNRNFIIDAADTFLTGNLQGRPIVGDFDGNGDDDLAVFNNNIWNFDLNAAGFDGNSDVNFTWGFPGVLDRPVAADFDQDGIDDIGLWVPRNSSQLPRPGAEWFILISNDPTGANRITGQINTLDHPFEPPPFGNDIYAEFGDELALPIVGNFDPPVTAENSTTQNNIEGSGDFDQDGDTDGADFLAWQRGYGMNVSSSVSEPAMSDGDGNYDSSVDHLDMELWASTFGQSSGNLEANDSGSNNSPLATLLSNFGATVTAGTNGDSDGNGRVNGADFLDWQRGSNTLPLATLVVEPTSSAASSSLAAELIDVVIELSLSEAIDGDKDAFVDDNQFLPEIDEKETYYDSLRSSATTPVSASSSAAFEEKESDDLYTEELLDEALEALFS